MEEMKDRFTASLIIWLPLLILWDDVLQGHMFNFYFGAFICLVLSLLSRKRESPVQNPWLSLFLLYFSAHFVFWLSGFYASRVPINYVLYGIDMMWIFFSALIIYQAVAESAKSKEWWFNFICVSALIQASIAICQHYWFNPVEYLVIRPDYSSYGNAQTAAGSLVCTNYLGAFLAIPLPMFFRRKWWLGIPIIIAALYFSFCRTAIFAITCMGAFWMWCSVVKYSVKLNGCSKDKWIPVIYGTAFAFLFALILAPVLYWIVTRNMLSISERYHEFWEGPILIWLSTWERFFFGVGPGITARVNNFLHNEAIPMAFNYGLIGLLIGVGMVISAAKRAWKSGAILFSSLGIILLDAIPNHVFHIPATALMCVFVLGLIFKPQKGENHGTA